MNIKQGITNIEFCPQSQEVQMFDIQYSLFIIRYSIFNFYK